METSRGCVLDAGVTLVSQPCPPVKANVVIDQTCRARLADFGLLTVVSDSINFFSSSAQAHGGTLRWMSPELIAPEKFGTETSRPTRASDCYSLGMVVYETVSGNIPFHNVPDRAVFLKVVEGEHPSRGVDFTDDLWKMMEQCWMSRPDHRPNVESVLEHLEMCSVGGDLGLGGLILTPAGNPDKLHVCAPLVGTSQDMRGVGSRGVPERPVSGGTPPVVPLDNHPVDSVSWFFLCPLPCLIISLLSHCSSPYGIERGNWFPERLIRSPLRRDPTRSDRPAMDVSSSYTRGKCVRAF